MEQVLFAEGREETIDVNASVTVGATGLVPLHVAASRGFTDIVKVLVERAEATVDAVDREGEVGLGCGVFFSESGWGFFFVGYFYQPGVGKIRTGTGESCGGRRMRQLISTHTDLKPCCYLNRRHY